jgi:hypothetical protein
MNILAESENSLSFLTVMLFVLDRHDMNIGLPRSSVVLTIVSAISTSWVQRKLGIVFS